MFVNSRSRAHDRRCVELTYVTSSSGRRLRTKIVAQSLTVQYGRASLEASRLIAGILTANERQGSGALMARRRSSKPELLDQLWIGASWRSRLTMMKAS